MEAPTIDVVAKSLEKWFVNDESLPHNKREFAKIIVEELRGIEINVTQR